MLLYLLLLFGELFINIVVGQNFEVGEKCQPGKGIIEGECKLYKDCEDAVSSVKHTSIQPYFRCGFEFEMEIVCCPIKSRTDATPKQPVRTTKKPTTYTGSDQRYGVNNNQRIVDKQCKKIIKDSIPPLDVHIIGGENASLGEFPHMAALGYLIGDEYDFSCGGTLISDDYVLTADHCVDNIEKKVPTIVRLGVVEIGKNTFNPDTDIRIAEIVSYPERTILYKYHDLVLLRLEKKPYFSIALVPACLYSGDTIPHVPLTVSGWGRSDVNRDIRSEVLQKANVTVVPSEVCEKNYSNWRKLPNGISPGQFCAGDPQARTDTCQGDSGGPIQAFTTADGYYRVIGITSFGRGCGSLVPGVYTRLHPYLDWIESVVWPNGV